MFKKLSIVTVILWILGWGIAYLFILPPINVSSLAFWIFFGPAVLLPLYIIIQKAALKKGFNKGKSLWPLFIVAIGAAVFFGGMALVSPITSSKAFASRIEVYESSFENDIHEVDFDNLPLLDKISSQKVGDRVVGQIPDLVSQFSINDEYSLINYKGSIVRVTPLDHRDFYKYFSNRSGTAGYVIVDTTTGDAEVVRTDKGIRYLQSSYLFDNLKRHVQLHNPFSILGDMSFELDEKGNPYWVIQTMRYKWVNIMPRVSGVIVCDAITGEMQKYKVGEVPAWIDNVYDAHLVMEEINDWGMYQGGYVNSQFTQKGVVQATDGYTYITSDDDVYMYTGITSIASDESNIGFVMVNLRTHKASYYAVPGAEEYGAMDSAVGQVQEKNYTSTFPLLINLDGRPTYLLSLKDAGGLVKMYAFVDVQNYQKVSVTDSSYGIKYAADEYLKMINGGSTPVKPDDPETHDLHSVIIEVKTITKDTGVVYITTTYDEKYKIEFSVDESIVPFIKEGDKYEVSCYTAENGLNIVKSIRDLTPTVPDGNTNVTPVIIPQEDETPDDNAESWGNVSINDEGGSGNN